MIQMVYSSWRLSTHVTSTENVRAFRIADGAEEAHERVVARDAFEGVDGSVIEGVTRFDG